MHVIVERSGHAVADQRREPDLPQRRRERVGKRALVPRVTAQEKREIERRDLVILDLERVAVMLGQPIGVRLAASSIVAGEILG